MWPLLLWSMSSNLGRSWSVRPGCDLLYSFMYLSNCQQQQLTEPHFPEAAEVREQIDTSIKPQEQETT